MNNKFKLSVCLALCSILPLAPAHAASSCDVNNDGNISPLDALLIINALNSNTRGNVENTKYAKLDVNGDGNLSPLDVLILINYLNSRRNSNNASCGVNTAASNSNNSNANNSNNQSGNNNSSNGNTSGSSNQSAGGGNSVTTQVVNGVDDEIVLEKSSEHLTGSYISIDEFKQVDGSAVSTGGLSRKRSYNGYLSFENNSTTERDIVTFVENNLQDVWGKTRTNTSRRIIYNGHLGTVESGASSTNFNFSGGVFEGSALYANGAGAKAEYSTSYKADGSNYLNLSKGKEIFIRLQSDGLSGSDSNSLSNFEITLADSSGKSHVSTYTAPFFTNINDMISGIFVLKIKLSAIKDKVDLSKIASFKINMMTRSAQDTSIDYIRVSTASAISSPEDLNNNPSVPPEAPVCKYSVIRRDSSFNAESSNRFEDHLSTDGRLRFASVKSLSDIKNSCIKDFLSKAISFCSAGHANDLSDIHLGQYAGDDKADYTEEQMLNYCKNYSFDHQGCVNALKRSLLEEDGSHDRYNAHIYANYGGIFPSTAEEAFTQFRNDQTAQALYYTSTFIRASFDDCIAYAIEGLPSTIERMKRVFPDVKPISNYPIAMDDNCNEVPISSGNNNQICDDIYYRYFASPISLDWENQNETSQTVTTFRINPNKESYYLWKASGSLPLLVYDPNKTGKITDGTQLFGNWTFGGKNKFASLDNKVMSGKTEWKNGYEALATLDSNFDETISGEELANLSLWFDYNQNAVSDEGEVKDLRSVGVTSLYLKNIKTTADMKSVYIEHGYTRNIHGANEVRKTIDWYSDAYESASDAITTFEALKSLNAVVKKDEKVKPKDPTDHANQNLMKKLSGVWDWSAVDMNVGEKSKTPLSGHFVFKTSKDGELKASSIFENPIEIEVKGQKTAAKKIVSKYDFDSVHIIENTLSDSKVIFTLSDDKTTTLSSADISNENGMITLKGQTISSYLSKVDNKTNMLKYQWIAKKITSKKSN